MARPIALTAAIAAALLAVSGAGGAGAQTPKRGGTVVVGTMREPPCINAYLLRCGDSTEIGNIMRVAVRGAFEVGPGFTWRPDLISRAEFTRKPPYTLTYHIRPEARWSDGVPVTAGDFVFTHETRRSMPEKDLINWEVFQLQAIESVKAIDAKTVKVVLRARSALWRGLFSRVLPRHALRGADFSTAWLDNIHNPQTGIAIGSGPFLVERWERGRQISFRRNPRYWGPHPAYLDRIILRFCRECGALGSEAITRLRAGELDLVRSTSLSGPEVRGLRQLPGARVLAGPGPLWEHLHIRMESGGHPALERKRVRQALAYGIDRVAIAQALFGANGARYRPSESAVFPSASAHYRPTWSRYRHLPVEARRLLEQEGCRRGVDRIYVCAGERLSLSFLTPPTFSDRARTIQRVQAQLRSVGIEVIPRYATSSASLNQILNSGEFDVALFSFVRDDPDVPITGAYVIYGCRGPALVGARNHSGYCRRQVTNDVKEARRILDEAQRVPVLRKVDAQVAKDLPVIPLYERPLVAGFRTSLRNVNVQTGTSDLFANAENWWLDS